MGRSCIECRSVRSRSELLRFVLVLGAPVLDAGWSAPGRGAYVCAHGDCLELAFERNRFARSFRRHIERHARSQWTAAVAGGAEAAAASLRAGARRGARDGASGAMALGRAALLERASRAARAVAERAPGAKRRK
jgi:predicted RNA-binding protein YlxR (DUF448 family)